MSDVDSVSQNPPVPLVAYNETQPIILNGIEKGSSEDALTRDINFHVKQVHREHEQSKLVEVSKFKRNTAG